MHIIYAHAHMAKLLHAYHTTNIIVLTMTVTVCIFEISMQLNE